MSIRSSWLVVFLFFFNLFLLEYSCFIMLCQFLLYSKNESSMHIHPLFWISFPFRLPQRIQQSSLCYLVGSHQLSNLYTESVVHICQFQSPNFSHPFPFPLGIHTFVLYLTLLYPYSSTYSPGIKVCLQKDPVQIIHFINCHVSLVFFSLGQFLSLKIL